ncbi:MAG: carbohydrate ABC transporter permease [Chloroflexia bacterium]|nr:carbohydrate ABC transporter permease [Chloroflexia bacterium]
MNRAAAFVTRAAIVLVLVAIAVIAVYPIVFMALGSFKTSLEYITNPLGWPASFGYVDNYLAMYYRFDIRRLVTNTVTYILLAGALSLAVSIPASYAFAKLRFPLRAGLRTAMIATLIMPPITFLVPSYVMMAQLRLLDTPLPVVLIWAATSVPGNVFLLSALMRGIPSEVLEAATIDGAGYFQTLGRMVIPLSLPGIVTVLIFNVTTWWNDLLIPLVFLQGEESRTVTVAAALLGTRFGMDYPLVITGLLLASLPPILAYVVLQRYIRRGLVVGALK